MKILHVMSQIQLTGAEVYAVQLAEKQAAAGNTLFMVSDHFHIPVPYVKMQLPLHNRKFKQRIINIIQLRRFIVEHDIDIVHAHSRASSWIAFFAVKGLKAPLISSIHGYQKPSWFKKLLYIYGNARIVVCESLVEHMQKDFSDHKTHLIRNGIAQTLERTKLPPVTRITFAGRTTGFKGDTLGKVIVELLSTLIESNPTWHFQFVGGPLESLSPAAIDKMRSLLSAYPERITFVGKVPSLVPYFDNSSCVVAAGRTAVEALMRGIPTVALGESCLEGLMTMDNRAACLYSNLGDILPERHAIQIDMARLTQDLHKAVALQKNPDILTQFYNEAFCLETVYQNVMEVYLSARMKKAYAKHIPILMYHKVLPEIEKSQHRTSVTIAQFESHCRLIKRFGYTPITFEDYDAFRNGKKSLSQFPKKPIILTFDDGYVDNETYALPILQQYGFKAVLYVLGDFNIDHNQWDTREGEPRQALLSSAAIKALSDSGVFEIGAHGLRHDSLPTLSAIKAYNDITQSKKNIETLLGKTLLSFAYPYGDYNEAIKAQVKEAGFLYAVATDHGGLHIEDDHFEIFRVNILPRDKGIHFLKKIQSWYRGRYFRRRGH